MPLFPVAFNSPGRWGINLQEADQLLHPNWATVTDSLQLNDSDQIACRGSITPTTSVAASAELLRIHNYINAAGTEIIVSTTATKILQGVGDLGAGGNDITPTGTPTNGFWKFINFNGKVLGWQAAHTPIVWSGSGDFAVISVSDGGTLPDGDVAHAAFGRVWAVDDDKQTVRFSGLLDETQWATASGAGSIDMRNVWTQGLDYVTAISSIGANLVIFGRKHIVFYTDGAGSTLGVDPDTMYVVDVIEGTGCVARDTVVAVGEGDLVFLSEVGLQSLARVVQSKDNPLSTISWQVADRLTTDLKTELNAQSSPATDVRGFTGCHIATTGQYLLIHNNGSVEDVFVFHMESTTSDEKNRPLVPIMLWDTSVLTNFRHAVQKRGGTVYFIGGSSNHINTYDPVGVLDATSTDIAVSYETGWIHWEQLELAHINKTLKFVQIMILNPAGRTSTTTFKWGTDYAVSLSTETAAARNGSPTRLIFDPVGDVDGQNYKFAVTDTSFGGKAIAQFMSHYKPGRIAFSHDVESQSLGEAPGASGPSGNSGGYTSLGFGQDYPTPVITSIDPSTLEEDQGAFAFAVYGTGFIPQSKIYWGATLLTTIYNGPTTLTVAAVPSVRTETAGVFDITVVNPLPPHPGTQESNALPFTVTAAPTPATITIGNLADFYGWSAFDLFGAIDPDPWEVLGEEQVGLYYEVTGVSPAYRFHMEAGVTTWPSGATALRVTKADMTTIDLLFTDASSSFGALFWNSTTTPDLATLDWETINGQDRDVEFVF